MYTNYSVKIETYAERHYIKNFAKKYKGAWEITLSALIREFQSFDVILAKTIAQEITSKVADTVICKTEFKVAGTDESRHGSGNRCIVAVHKKEKRVCVLMVYHKNDLGAGNETINWKQAVCENFPEYRNLI